MQSSRLNRQLLLVILLPIIGSCAPVEWAMMTEKEVAEAVLAADPFDSPMSIVLDARSGKTCNQISDTRSPRSWIDLESAGLARLEPVERGSAKCALMPAGKAAIAGNNVTWKPVWGERWQIPVGHYVMKGTGKFDEMDLVMSRSVLKPGSVSFSWTFNPYRKLERVVSSETTFGDDDMTGNATAELTRTKVGWKVASLSMTPIVSVSPRGP